MCSAVAPARCPSTDLGYPTGVEPDVRMAFGVGRRPVTDLLAHYSYQLAA